MARKRETLPGTRKTEGQHRFGFNASGAVYTLIKASDPHGNAVITEGYWKEQPPTRCNAWLPDISPGSR
jgi:hypothetical protein